MPIVNNITICTMVLILRRFMAPQYRPAMLKNAAGILKENFPLFSHFKCRSQEMSLMCLGIKRFRDFFTRSSVSLVLLM